MLTIAAKWQRAGRQGKTPRLIVIHCTVSREMGTGAEAVARYFATSTRPGSSHTVHDNNSTVRCVADEDTAYGAAGANNDGLHAELVGMPDQTEAEWLDPFSLAMLHEAAPTIRGWSEKYDIPLRWLTVDEVATGARGLCTHADVSKAFPKVSTGHWDPGPGFSKPEALRIWSGQPHPFPVPPPVSLSVEDDMPKPALVFDPEVQFLVWLVGADGVSRIPVTKTAPFESFVAAYGPPVSIHPDLFHAYVDISNVDLDAEDLAEIKATVKAAMREGSG